MNNEFTKDSLANRQHQHKGLDLSEEGIKRLNEDLEYYRDLVNISPSLKKNRKGCSFTTEGSILDLFINDNIHSWKYENGETVSYSVAKPKASRDRKNDVKAEFKLLWSPEYLGIGESVFNIIDFIVWQGICNMPELCELDPGEKPCFSIKDVARFFHIENESYADLKWLSDSIWRLQSRFAYRSLLNAGIDYKLTKTEKALKRRPRKIRLLPIDGIDDVETANGTVYKYFSLYANPALWKICQENKRLFRITKPEIIKDLLSYRTEDLVHMKWTILSGLAWKKRKTIKLSNFYTKQIPINDHPDQEVLAILKKENQKNQRNAKKRVERYLNKLIEWKAIKSYEWVLNKENELTLKCIGVSL